MPELDITIGGRSFQVACQAGEEDFLKTAAGLLDTEARALVAQAGRITETRMLLMAGLMLADRLAGLEDQLRGAEARLRDMESRPILPPQRIEVPVVPPQLVENLAELAARAESLAEDAETRAARIADGVEQAG
jgi:cell division protein ZapA